MLLPGVALQLNFSKQETNPEIQVLNKHKIMAANYYPSSLLGQQKKEGEETSTYLFVSSHIRTKIFSEMEILILI